MDNEHDNFNKFAEKVGLGLQPATIHNWSVRKYAAGVVLEGEIRNHPRQAEFRASRQRTSFVRNVVGDTVTTYNTVYLLGEPNTPCERAALGDAFGGNNG